VPTTSPLPCGPPEVAALVRLLWTLRPAAGTIGSAADPVSRANAGLLADAWPGAVLDTVVWPEAAASWLRQARRFTAQGPDAWLVTGTPAGWLGMARRLARSTNWSAARTVATSGLAETSAAFPGMRGTYPDGRTWAV
jgi:CelD/BcsL family acetyltransferase involved in cellulose biosynthesis